MVILLHVLIAVASIGSTTYLLIRPSRSKLYASYALAAATIISGAYVAWSTHARLLQVCTTGLLYIAAVLAALLLARGKLAAERIRARNR